MQLPAATDPHSSPARPSPPSHALTGEAEIPKHEGQHPDCVVCSPLRAESTAAPAIDLAQSISNARFDIDTDYALLDAGVPERFQGARLEHFIRRPGTERALQLAQECAKPNSRRGLVMVGPPGTGKTTLAVGILAELARAHLRKYPEETWEEPGRVIPVAGGGTHQLAPTQKKRPRFRPRFVVVGALLAELRRRAGGDTPDKYEHSPDEDMDYIRDPVAALSERSFVVLDDLGRTKASDWAMEIVFGLVDARYGAELKTVVTSNYTPMSLARSGWDAIVSRLVEDADVVSIKATDYRAERRS